MKKTYKTISIVLVVLALLVIILAGCSDMMAKMGEIVITVEPSDKIRTTVTSYTVTGTLEGSKASPLSLEIVVPATEISIPSISPGKWTFVIKAFDSVGEIGEGTQVVTLSEGQNVNLNVPVDFVPIPLSISNIPFKGLELSKEYDGNTSLTFGQNATYTVDQTTLAGLRKDQGIQDSVILEATATYTDKTAGNGKTLDIVYALIYSQDTAIEGKYTPPAPYTESSGAITKKQLTITDPSFETKERVYDGTNSLPVTAGSLIGVVDGDELTVTATATYNDKKAGTGKDITVTYTLSGSDADNYAKPVAYTTNTGTIAQKPLGFSVAAVNKTYDGYDGTTGTIALLGVLGTDEVAATGTFTFSDKNAGPDKGVSVEGITLSGAEAGNYILGTTEASTTATISKKPLDNAGTTLLPKVYD
ncbi:MAG TPA: YDG domain-containing protein, partial [Sphaerochaeta sp.]|nr:YDG domain-containing protein [Sphaerochaeta sp.]